MDLKQLLNKYQPLIAQATTAEALDQIDQQLFNKKTGELGTALRSLKGIPDATQRKQAGETANQVKATLQQALAEARHSLGTADIQFDRTLPPIVPTRGHWHPLHLVQNELVDIFRSMSFAVYEGNELETEDYCFEYLNIPASHPARDLQDTFYIDRKRRDGLKEVMRTHTSNMQVRVMKQLQPPLRVIVPGRVFRNEAIDASHEHTFYQMEGMVVDKNISIANLTYMLRQTMSSLLNADVNIRLRPGYFPYVEPGFEADCSCTNCAGKGCSMCKQTGWVEMLGCGMIHPNVFKAVGYAPGEYTGFAFGLGLNRLAMLKYGINDIRHFMAGDLRFLKQF
ncbi:MAG: hypothetical protein ACD_41C00295G0002 [uncultured bacterium]|nr:MAG: hypothetical protein ACD_41C00295G0002 [uncultured bacterium]